MKVGVLIDSFLLEWLTFGHPYHWRIVELSFPRTFAPRSDMFRSLELSFSRTFVPWNFRSHELSLTSA